MSYGKKYEKLIHDSLMKLSDNDRQAVRDWLYRDKRPDYPAEAVDDIVADHKAIVTRLNTREKRIRHLEAENTELLKDRERLEKLERWLEEDDGHKIIRPFDADDTWRLVNDGCVLAEGDTLPEAIDALELPE